MTTTTTTPISSDVRSGRRGYTPLFIAAPLVMALGRILLVPIDDQDWNSVMTKMAASQGRSDAGWLLAMAACGLLAVTAFVLTSRLRSAGKRRSASFAMTATALGWAGTAAICFGGIYLSEAAKAPDRAAQVAVQEAFNDGWSVGVVFLMCVAGAIGYIVLSVSLARASVITKGAATLIAIGGAATLLTMGGPVTVLLVIAALLLTAGHVLAARSLNQPV